MPAAPTPVNREVKAAPLPPGSPGPDRGSGRGSRILVVLDDPVLGGALRRNLELDGYRVQLESAGAWGLVQAQTWRPHLLIADLAVLERERPRLLVELRTEFEFLPVLLLSTCVVEASAVPGFRLGVDEFVLRTARVAEMYRRVDLMLDRAPVLAGRGAPEPRLRIGDLEVRPHSRTVLRAGRPVDLRLKEFDLLAALLARDGGVAPRADLLREVWGYRAGVASRTLDTHVAELRRKLEENPARPRHILTVRRIGYRLAGAVADPGR